MAVYLSPVGGVAAQFFNNDGVPLAGGLIYTYAAGTSTPQATYTTSAGSIEHTNPIVLDSAGRVPGGEIWLSDGQAYKFVIKDSNLTLLGTYDNIVGINSNFVNYTNSQEIQTATAGQTVFTFTTMAYQPGTNSLSVFVDGVNQYGPGGQYAYTETSGTSVTFASGLHEGAEVKFTTSQLNTSGAVDADQVSYLYPAPNSVAQTVENRLAQEVFLTDFGKSAELVKYMSNVTAFANGNTLNVVGYFAEGDGGAGQFYWDAFASKTLHNGGTIIDPDKTFPTDWTNATQRQNWFTPGVSGTGVWVRTIGDYISLKWFGAVGDDVQNDQEAIQAFIAVWIKGQQRGYIPTGRYKAIAQIEIDVSLNPNRRFPELFGDGPYSSVLNNTFSASSDADPAFFIHGTSAGPDHFQGKITRVGFQTNTPYVGFQIGYNDYSDNHGNYEIDQCYFGNASSTGPFNTAVRLNWLFDCHFQNCVMVAYPMQGTALDMQKVQFTQFDGGSISNAYYAIYIRNSDSYAVTFNTVDIENVVHGIYCTSPYAQYIKYNNGYMDIWDPLTVSYPVGAYPVYVGAIGSGGLIIDNVMLGRSQSFVYNSGAGWQGFMSPSSLQRELTLIRGFYPYQTTPSVPASDIAEYNYSQQIQRVRIWGGSVTKIFLNGEETTYTTGEFTLYPNDYIAIRYSIAPIWRWKAQP